MAGSPSRARAHKPTEFVGLERPPQASVDRSPLLETSREAAFLIAVSGRHRGAEWSLGGATVTIGRGEDADVRIDEPAASRRHAHIERRADGYYLRDLGSTNGTFLKQVLHRTAVKLRADDRFRIGETELVFRDPADGARNGS
jgi:hypothetical protein